ncbi:hypothetical protein QWY82_18930 [Simiduia curdlanivorans]|uniref:Uncharacterized protein n=1 Tax=Simiduia curdlanivorans TaxID=1492769 RepID=A0ABV8V3W1_9GAMM|nr:hypothetical protein [Simiduia curdlanivorans]MDN3640882.1 hypothetical protein [Simiduia curdlanivorans]
MNAREFNVGDCIYDGMEEGYHELKFKLHPCSAKKLYTISELVNFNELENNLGDRLARNIAESVHGLPTVFNGHVSYKSNGNELALYFVINHDLNIVYILSAGEFQPCRYMCNYEGIFHLHE